MEDFDLKDYENVLEEAKCYVCSQPSPYDSHNPHRMILITLTTRLTDECRKQDRFRTLERPDFWNGSASSLQAR